MQPLSHRATEYHLQGKDVQIVFRRGDDQPMTLEYNGQAYSGETLTCEQTMVGLAVSILVEAQEDNYTIWLTVIIPEANCPPEHRSVHVDTFAVFTTKRTSFGGPDLVDGQIDLYRLVFPLAGNAWCEN